MAYEKHGTIIFVVTVSVQQMYKISENYSKKFMKINVDNNG